MSDMTFNYDVNDKASGKIDSIGAKLKNLKKAYSEVHHEAAKANKVLRVGSALGGGAVFGAMQNYFAGKADEKSKAQTEEAKKNEMLNITKTKVGEVISDGLRFASNAALGLVLGQTLMGGRGSSTSSSIARLVGRSASGRAGNIPSAVDSLTNVTSDLLLGVSGPPKVKKEPRTSRLGGVAKVTGKAGLLMRGAGMVGSMARAFGPALAMQAVIENFVIPGVENLTEDVQFSENYLNSVSNSKLGDRSQREQDIWDAKYKNYGGSTRLFRDILGFSDKADDKLREQLSTTAAERYADLSSALRYQTRN